MSCRICLEEEGPFVSPCACKGSTAHIHEECLIKWIETSGADKCEICHEKFTKEETCSWEPRKYFKACVSCKTKSPNNQGIVWRMGTTIVGLTLILFVSIPVDFFILMSVVMNIAIVGCSLIHQITTYNRDNIEINIHNVLMTWKMCFSIPYACIIVVNYMILSDECDASCFSLSNICDSTCPYRIRFNREQAKLQHALFLDVVNILIYILFRSTVLCFTHMRSLKFSNRTEEEETLLDHPSDSSSSGAINTCDSTSSFLSVRSSSSLDIFDPATNDRIDSMI